MNVSLSNLNKQYQVHYQRSAIDTFTRQQTMQNGMIDLYVRGNNSVAYSEIYSSFASEKNSYISDLLLLVINNDSSK